MYKDAPDRDGDEMQPLIEKWLSFLKHLCSCMGWISLVGVQIRAGHRILAAWVQALGLHFIGLNQHCSVYNY
jgi:hypothetical protein